MPSTRPMKRKRIVNPQTVIGIGKAIYRGWKAYNDAKRQKTEDVRGTVTANPVSTAITRYHDVDKLYTKRYKRKSIKSRKLAYKRKRFRRAVRRAVKDRTQLCIATQRGAALKTCDSNTSGVTTWNSGPAQILMSASTTALDLMLWSGRFQNNVSVSKDIVDIYLKLSSGILTPSTGTTNTIPWVDQVRYYINHCRLTLGIHENTGNAQNIEIYEFVAARDMPKGDAYYSPKAAWQQVYNDTGTLGGTAPTVNSLGVTPLDLPAFGKHWKLKNKTRIFLEANGNTMFQIKGPTGVYDYSKNSDLEAIKGKTTHIMIISLSAIGFGTGLNVNPLSLSWSKSYHFKPVNGDKFGLMGNTSYVWELAV